MPFPQVQWLFTSTPPAPSPGLGCPQMGLRASTPRPSPLSASARGAPDPARGRVGNAQAASRAQRPTPSSARLPGGRRHSADRAAPTPGSAGPGRAYLVRDGLDLGRGGLGAGATSAHHRGSACVGAAEAEQRARSSGLRLRLPSAVGLRLYFSRPRDRRAGGGGEPRLGDVWAGAGAGCPFAGNGCGAGAVRYLRPPRGAPLGIKDGVL